MNPNPHTTPRGASLASFLSSRKSAAFSALALIALSAAASASDWTGGTANWSSDGTPGWGGTGVPNAAGAVANHPNALGSTSNVDGTYTVGTIAMTNTSTGTWIISGTTGGVSTEWH